MDKGGRSERCARVTREMSSTLRGHVANHASNMASKVTTSGGYTEHYTSLFIKKKERIKIYK